MPRVHVGGAMQALIHSHSSHWPPYLSLKESIDLLTFACLWLYIRTIAATRPRSSGRQRARYVTLIRGSFHPHSDSLPTTGTYLLTVLTCHTPRCRVGAILFSQTTYYFLFSFSTVSEPWFWLFACLHLKIFEKLKFNFGDHT